MSKLLIASGSGELFLYDSNSIKIETVFTNPNPNEWFMGLTKHKDFIVASSTLGLHLFEWQEEKLFCLCTITDAPRLNPINPRFQHIRAIGDIILAPSQTSNSIFIFKIKDLILKTFGVVKIARTKEQTYFDQICGVSFDQNKIYVLFHSLASDPNTSSLLELTNSFEIIGNRDFGWSAFGIAVCQGNKYVICNHNKKNNLGGFIKDNRLRLQWKPEFTMMDIAMTKDSIFLVGSTIIEDKDTTISGGVVMRLDHNYNIKNVQMYSGYGQFKGCMVVGEEDLTNNTDQLDSSSLIIKKYNDKNIHVTVFGKIDSNDKV